MIKDTKMIQYIDNIKIFNHDDKLEYYVHLKDGFYFELTNSNMIHVYNIYDLNKVLSYGVFWGSRYD